MSRRRTSTSRAVLFACISLIGCDCGGDRASQSVDSVLGSDADVPDATPSDAASDAAQIDAAVGSDAAAASDAQPPLDASPAPSDTSARIGPGGGTFGNDSLSLTVPPGALSTETLLGVSLASNGAPDARGGTWELGPNGTTFATSATLTFFAGKIANGIALADLTVVTAGPSGWEILQDIARDATAQTVSAPLLHFSPYALVYAPATPVTVVCPASACANGACEPGAVDWTCRCSGGYAYDPQNKTCVVETHCVGAVCEHGKCNEAAGGYTCTCDKGYDYDAATKTCVNHNECVPGVCANGTCNDLVADFSCTCKPGYDYDASTKTCLDHNDCKPGYCAGGSCVDAINDYSCTNCPFEGSGTKSCDGKDDCAGVTCANGHCVDGSNHYACACNSGFDQIDAKTCAPHNDCPAGACANGTCVDLAQDYKCACNPGFDGSDSKACTKHSYCMGNPCGTGGTCTEQPTGYSCACTAPYSLQGNKCVNLCAGVACSGGTCSEGKCTCPTNFELKDGVCTPKDLCAGVSCGLGGTCDKTSGRCTCSAALHTVVSADGKTCQCGREPHPSIPAGYVVFGDCDGQPANGCEASLNTTGVCGLCAGCISDYQVYPIKFLTDTPASGGSGNGYSVEIPTCPLGVKQGELCGHYDKATGSFGYDWYNSACAATATGPVKCVAKPNN